MIYLLYTIHVFVCLFLILVVLLQQGKGADLSVFGGGATQAAFGARGAVSLLHKLTVWGFVAFIATTISIGFMTSAERTTSVLSDVPATEGATSEEAVTEELATDEAEALEAEALEVIEEGDGAPINGTEDDGSAVDETVDEAVDGGAAAQDGDTDDGSS